MKKLLQYIFLLAAIGFSGWAIYYYSLDPCQKPLEYGLGRFDTQFDVSKQDFRAYIAEAEKVWEKALGRDIFNYDPDASFKINLIYDQRQLETMQKQKTEFGLSAAEAVFKKLDAEFSLFKDQYESRTAAYERDLVDFEQNKASYDQSVDFWNKKGGAPKETFEKLEAERVYLNAEAERLNTEAKAINQMAKELNLLLERRNAEAKKYNQIIAAYNRQYGGGLEFNQAEYVGNPQSGKGEINVYQYGGRADLILALAHEFGHALGMDHVEGAKSIMYYLTSSDMAISLTPSSEDLVELQRVCK